MSDTITKVYDDGSVTVSDGWSLFLGEGFEGRAKVGDTIELIPVGGGVMSLGRQFRGVIINGETLWEKSEAEVEAERQARKTEYERKEQEEEAESRAAFAARFAFNPLAFDWDREGPSDRAAAALDRVEDEAEFPMSYSGQSWRYAFRLWKATAQTPYLLDGLGPYEFVPGIECDDLGLSGFMEGWARNAVRQMRGKLPKANGAVLTIGGDGEEEIHPSIGSAQSAMQRAIG